MQHLHKLSVKIVAILSVFLIGISAIQSNAQTTVTIGSLTSTSYTYLIPVNSLYNYTYSQQVLLSSEIDMTGNIVKVRFKHNAGSMTNNDNWKVYLGYMTASSFATTTSWIPLSSLTEIYTGIVTASGGWVEIVLATPFFYDKTIGNLVVAVDENSAGYTYTSNMFTVNSGSNRSIYYRSDGTNPDPATPPSGTLNSYFNTIQLDIVPNVACDTVTIDAGTLSTPIDVCPSTPFNLAPTGATSATGLTFVWESRPTGTTAWSTITGATGPFYSSPGITSATDYRLIITCTATGLSDTTNIHTVNIKPIFECLCTPIYTTGCSSGDNIRDFVLYGETMDIINMSTPCPSLGYANYTTMTADLLQGETYSGFVTTSYGSAYENYRIWIDYNENGIFESTESVAFGGPLSSTMTGNYTFTVPMTATPGLKAMRVRLIYSGTASSIDPCASYSWGETHDYTVQIISPCAQPTTSSAIDITATSASIVYTNTATVVGTLIEYGPAGFTPGTGTIIYPASSPQIITDLIPNTNYEYYVRNLCSATDTSMHGTAYTFATLCQVPMFISVIADTVCNEGIGVFEVVTSANATVQWFESSTATTPLAEGFIYTTDVHDTTTTYYAEASIGNAGICISDRMPVTLLVQPNPSLTLTPEIDTICIGGAATFVASSDVPVTYLWSTGDETAAMTTGEPGTYTVTITDNNGCQTTGEVFLDTFLNINISGFDYIPTIFTDPYTYKFTPISPVAVTEYYWVFGDGHTSTEVEPTHTYAAFGTYNVVLIVSNDCTADTVYMEIHVRPENTSANSIEADKFVNVYPNPAQQYINIEMIQSGTLGSIRIYNSLGQLMYQEDKINKINATINVNSLPTGAYHIVIESDKGERMHKMFNKLN